ncbi:hypothetical protein K443DRAFT_14452 [Laccaria amethystina LaAM-08-1]|uniref:Uncharacterized protein n=1 Tax=Laccaria amethystina LaAM-08-1 TaxID=1095629 RepID=A0A0C9X1C8_9AGAR|nr:hypothetical protein K443DRAFT_14452 [Laccaria amethystina LaAM-08-1]
MTSYSSRSYHNQPTYDFFEGYNTEWIMGCWLLGDWEKEDHTPFHHSLLLLKEGKTSWD